MLAVTRKVKERIHINDDIVIHILDIRSKSVKIGVAAPNDYLIFRGEIYDNIVESNKEMMAPEFGDADVQAFLKNKGKKK